MNVNAKMYIMAGGGGTRLKPLSQTEKGKLPKQFLRIVGKRTLLQETIGRLPEQYEVGIIPEKRYSEEVYRQASEIGREVSVLEEPFGCNTAAAILYAALFEQKALHSADRVVCFLPADHLMNPEVFRVLLEKGVQIAEESDTVVTIGVQPDRPETNYGYIQTGRPFRGSLEAYAVLRFVEKPDRDTAAMYIDDGGYFWNAGIFISRTSVLIREAGIHCPNILRPIEAALSIDRLGTVADAYRTIKASGFNISIDYALMEHIADSMALIPAPAELEWNDLGNWESLSRYMTRDERNNVTFSGTGCEFNGSERTMVCNYTNLPILVEDCRGLLIVATENGILIRSRNDA